MASPWFVYPSVKEISKLHATPKVQIIPDTGKYSLDSIRDAINVWRPSLVSEQIVPD